MKMLVSFFLWILMLTACSKYRSDESEIWQKGGLRERKTWKSFKPNPWSTKSVYKQTRHSDGSQWDGRLTETVPVTIEGNGPTGKSWLCRLARQPRLPTIQAYFSSRSFSTSSAIFTLVFGPGLERERTELFFFLYLSPSPYQFFLGGGGGYTAWRFHFVFYMPSSREQRKRVAISVARGLHTNIATRLTMLRSFFQDLDNYVTETENHDFRGATEEGDRMKQEPKRFQPLKKVGLILCTAWPPPIEAFTVSYVILSHALHLVYFCHNDWIKLTVVFFFLRCPLSG